MGDPDLPGRTRLGPAGRGRARVPPGRRPTCAGAGGRDRGGDAAAWGGEEGAAEALRALDPARDRIVSYVGKLIVSKGVDLLLAAWPLVVARVPDARLVVVGFGTYRDALGRDGARRSPTRDLGAVREIAARGRELEGGPAGELAYLAAFLDSLEGEARDAYLAAAPEAAARVSFTGRLEHADLPAPAAGLRGAGRAEHVPRGVRHGRRRGGRLRGAAAVRRALRAGRGDHHAGGRAGPRAGAAALLRARARRRRGDRREAGRVAVPAGRRARAARPPRWRSWRARTYGWESGGRRGDRGGRGAARRAPPSQALPESSG